MTGHVLCYCCWLVVFYMRCGQDVSCFIALCSVFMQPNGLLHFNSRVTNYLYSANMLDLRRHSNQCIDFFSPSQSSILRYSDFISRRTQYQTNVIEKLCFVMLMFCASVVQASVDFVISFRKELTFSTTLHYSYWFHQKNVRWYCIMLVNLVCGIVIP